MLTEKTKSIVKSTTPLFKEKGEEITSRMYMLLFAEHPEVKELFAQAPTGQPRILATAIMSYCNNLDNLAILEGELDQIARRHVFSHVQAEHYPFVGKALIQAIKDTLGDVATDEVIEAWQAVYLSLASILIQRESEIYASTY
jgi:nitric oxide dioxygenase